VVSPWLAAPWLAGAWIARRDGTLAWGAAAGFVLLAATVATYLAMAGAGGSALLPGLPLLVVAAGPAYGAAGAALDHGARGRFIAAVVIGATLVVEGVLLQQVAAERPLERGLLVAEAVAGVLLATWIGGRGSGLIVVAIGAVVLGSELVPLATIGSALP
jgi:hypothetical protein